MYLISYFKFSTTFGDILGPSMYIKNKHKIVYVLSIIFFGFIILTVLVLVFPISLVDKEFSEVIQEHHYPLLDTVMQWISWPGMMPNSLILVLLTSGVFLLLNYKREALFILFTLLSGVVSYFLKVVINRPRPTADLVRILKEAEHQSFPSGHVLFYVVFFGFVIIVIRHLKYIPSLLKVVIISLCLFLIFSVPFSRIYLGAHWFTDVAGGFLLGLLLLFFLSASYLKKQNT